MRSTWQRLLHTILFELCLVLLLVPSLTWILGQKATKMGALAVFISVLAMSWNYLFNWAFDKALLRLGRPLQPRSWKLRTVHALLFEAGFIFVSVPAVMAWLNFTFLQALALDGAFLIAVPIYAYLFNWAFDAMVPASWKKATA